MKCRNEDKLLHTLALLRFELVQKKCLIFVNTVDKGFRLKLFLEQVVILQFDVEITLYCGHVRLLSDIFSVYLSLTPFQLHSAGYLRKN